MPVDLRERLIAAADEPLFGSDTDAILRRANRRLRRARGLFAGGAAVLAVATLLLVWISVPSDDAEVVTAPVGQAAVVEIQETSDAILARLLDGSADAEPADVERALRGAGIDATVAAQPTDPAQVGHWISVETTSGHPPESGRPDPGGLPTAARLDTEDPRVMRFPRPVSGTYRLWFGRPAQPGEFPVAPSTVEP